MIGERGASILMPMIWLRNWVTGMTRLALHKLSSLLGNKTGSFVAHDSLDGVGCGSRLRGENGQISNLSCKDIAITVTITGANGDGIGSQLPNPQPDDCVNVV